ncbi:hypothetical protein IBTHAUMO2_1050007 [Nitrosopumilaceae archaeon]|nr:hypothetical protein IBTHAUMO2_1050007 [Nitrosopumilaceae archaeon]
MPRRALGLAHPYGGIEYGIFPDPNMVGGMIVAVRTRAKLADFVTGWRAGMDGTCMETVVPVHPARPRINPKPYPWLGIRVFSTGRLPTTSDLCRSRDAAYYEADKCPMAIYSILASLPLGI